MHQQQSSKTMQIINFVLLASVLTDYFQQKERNPPDPGRSYRMIGTYLEIEFWLPKSCVQRRTIKHGMRCECVSPGYQLNHNRWWRSWKSLSCDLIFHLPRPRTGLQRRYRVFGLIDEDWSVWLYRRGHLAVFLRRLSLICCTDHHNDFHYTTGLAVLRSVWQSIWILQSWIFRTLACRTRLEWL